MNESFDINTKERERNGDASNHEHQDINKMEKGKSFEKRVSAIFKLMGFNIKLNHTFAGNEIDIFLEKKKSIGNQKEYYICECKNWDQKVGINVVNKVNLVRESIRRSNEKEGTARDCHALIVSPIEFTLRAKEAAEVLDILLYTYDQLLAEVMDFNQYLTSLIESVESDEAKQEYIEQDFFWIESETKNGNSFDFIEQWLNSPVNNLLLLLGDCGNGKTSFVRQLTYRMAKTYTNKPETVRIPFLVELGPGWQQKSLIALLLEQLKENMVEPVNKQVFLKLLSDGKFLLILDAFDEMGNIFSAETTLDFVYNLNQMVRGEAKVILTARTHSFKNNREVEQIFRMQEHDGSSKKFLSSYLEVL